MLLLTIGSWWNALSGVQQIFWTIAIVFSILLLIQFVFTLTSSDMDAPANSTNFKIKNKGSTSREEVDTAPSIARCSIVFFTFFGWTGIVALNAGNSPSTATLIASLVGLFVVLLLSYDRWQSANNQKIVLTKELLSVTGEVLLEIPPAKQGVGKVQLPIQGKLEEIEAVTNDGMPLSIGIFIRVVEVKKDQVVVEMIDE